VSVLKVISGVAGVEVEEAEVDVDVVVVDGKVDIE
jgi:hypothetical protein